MRYLLLVYSDLDRWSELPATGADEEMAEHAALIDGLTSSGTLVGCSPLAEPANTTIVRVRDGATTAAPLDEPTCAEHLAGYYLVDCADSEDAVRIAARIPDARSHSVALHPLMELPGLRGNRGEGLSTEPWN